MRRSTSGSAAVALVSTVLLATAAFAADSRIEQGQRDYQALCGSCHGPEGRGDGPAAPALNPRPADLTTIANRHGGTFSSVEVSRMIDGREPVVAHGSRSMPVWGNSFSEGTDRRGFGYTKGRIQLLVSYLKSIQQPPPETSNESGQKAD